MTYPPAGDAGQHTGAVPVCPRHPGRESYVRCQRCERPVCPECQRAAAVGVQCVDCVREHARTMPAARTVFGGRAGNAPPRVTQSIIGICAAVFVIQLVRGNAFTNDFTFAPWEAVAQPWRFLTSAFLHSPTFIPHIFFNMYALWVIGPYLEGLLGRLRFAALYLISAVGGSVGYFLLAPATPPDQGLAWWTGALGASGAIFGLFAGLLLVNRKLGRDTAGIIGLIVINGALGFIISGVAWQAHLGGLVTGAAVTAALTYPPREQRAVLQPAGLLAVLLLLLLLVLWKVSTVPAGLLA